MFASKPFCPLRSAGEYDRADCSPDCRWQVKLDGVDDDGLDRYACAVTVIAEQLIRHQTAE